MSNIQNLDPIEALQEELKPYRHCFSVDEVDEITLLSIEEARRLPKDILKAGIWWWLRSPGISQDYVASVDCIGNVIDYGNSVNYGNIGVRPAFRINNLKLPFGEKVHINNTVCTVIGKGLVLSNNVACYHRFDKESNNWDTGELKRFIESDDFKNLL